RALGDAATDQGVEHAGVDGLVRAAARKPEPNVFSIAYDAVDVRRPGTDAEPPRGASLDLELNRLMKGRGDCVQFVAPRGEGALFAQCSRCFGDRGRPC